VGFEEYKSRKLFVPDASRVQARTTAEELREVAREVAKKLNKAKGPVAVLIPLRGWSSLDIEGMPLYDPEADKAFIQELKAHLHSTISVIDLDLHLNTRPFAEEAVHRFVELYAESKKRKRTHHP
jgi:uncharacterized protein (UPF0261 family)